MSPSFVETKGYRRGEWCFDISRLLLVLLITQVLVGRVLQKHSLYFRQAWCRFPHPLSMRACAWKRDLYHIERCGQFACKNSINWHLAQRLTLLWVLSVEPAAQPQVVGWAVASQHHKILVKV
jgi:hypothetical protein